MSDYDNARTDVSSPGGGSNRVTIPATPFTIRGGTSTGGATSVPCKFCRIQETSGNTTTTRVRIGATCTSSTGVEIPSYPTVTPYPVSDLNKLYFLGGTDGDTIDIEYFK
ncbi:hypothetical protein LCGC14_1314710 [marine sediment metagenome]|uniref:Uncharacterized protein n=1 Tax=marine sediment metagenome TaxID=412755 RepID=A0A0F9KLA4_9ZZZZ